MAYVNSTQILESIYKHGYLISFEKGPSSGRIMGDSICLCTSEGHPIHKLPRAMFADFIAASLIEQGRREDSDGRIFFRLTADGRARAAA